jgi:hypothetical protein
MIIFVDLLFFSQQFAAQFHTIIADKYTRLLACHQTTDFFLSMPTKGTTERAFIPKFAAHQKSPSIGGTDTSACSI